MSVDNPWKDRVLAYNRKRSGVDEQARDMQEVIKALSSLPLLAQIKRLLPVRVVEVLEKYGVEGKEVK